MFFSVHLKGPPFGSIDFSAGSLLQAICGSYLPQTLDNEEDVISNHTRRVKIDFLKGTKCYHKDIE